MKKIIIVVALLVLIVFVIWWQNDQQQSEENSLLLYGNVDIREVSLAINGSERINRMLVQEGEQVEQGQLLAQLNSQRFEAEVARVKALLAAQQAVLDRLVAGSRPEEIAQAESHLAAAQALEHETDITARRLTKLLSQRSVSPSDVDHAKASFEVAHAKRIAAGSALKLVKIGSRTEDIAAAQATLKAYQAQLVLAHHMLDDASLYAPAKGVIRNRVLQPGDMASPQKPLYTLALTDPVWVRAYLPEPMLGRVRSGATAWITTDSYPDKRYQGWVGYISPTAEFTPKTVQTPELRTRLVYSVRIFACNPEGELRLGMPASVEIELDQTGMGSEPQPCGS